MELIKYELLRQGKDFYKVDVLAYFESRLSRSNDIEVYELVRKNTFIVKHAESHFSNSLLRIQREI